MHVVFLYNERTEDPSHAAEEEDPTQSPILAALQRLGHEVTPIACTLDLSTAQRKLQRARPDVILNRVESLGGSDAMMAAVPLLLEAMHIPYTGCSAEALAATASKLAVKDRLLSAGLPTPSWITADGTCHGLDDFGIRGADCGLSIKEHRSVSRESSNTPCSPLPAPCLFILKSVHEHASFRLDDGAIVEADDPRCIVRALKHLEAETTRPFFAERFVAGREFNLSVWGDKPQVLPPAEIDFSAYPAGKPHIVAHRAKCDEDSFEYHHTPRRFDIPAVDAALLRNLSELAIDCAQHFHLSGYARVDFRVDTSGRPWILEINSNPCLSPGAGFAAALERAGFEYDEAIQLLLNHALARSLWSARKQRPKRAGRQSAPADCVAPA